MKAARGSRTARAAGHAGDAAARERVEALFAELDRLTPDELGRIGLRRLEPEPRSALLAEVAAAARRTGRGGLVDDARTTARDALVRRFASGGLNPTWLGLNWGVSQGTADARAAVIEAVEDAAAAAVVADDLAPETLDALSLAAHHLASLSGGRASSGSLEQAIAPAAGPEYAPPRIRWVAILVVALFVASFALAAATSMLGETAGLVAAAAAVAVVLWLGRPRRVA